MASIDEIIAEIIDTVDDPSIETSVDLEAKVNGAISAIAASPHIRLPELLTSQAVDTVLAAESVAMPTEYQKGLHWCFNKATGNEVFVADNMGVMRHRFTDQSLVGPVVAVCVTGKKLNYQGIPGAAETLQLGFYGKPPIYSGDDEPDCLPVEFQDDIPVHYCCWKLFAKIESGLEGAKVDTDYHKNEYYRGLDELGKYLNRLGGGVTRKTKAVKGNFL